MKVLFFILLTLFVSASSYSQDSLSTRERNLRQTLGMSAQDYNVFSKAMKDYQQKTLAVQKDSTRSFESKKKAMESLFQQKQQYISAHLTADQQDKFKAYLKTNERHSQAFLKRQHR